MTWLVVFINDLWLIYEALLNYLSTINEAISYNL